MLLPARLIARAVSVLVPERRATVFLALSRALALVALGALARALLVCELSLVALSAPALWIPALLSPGRRTASFLPGPGSRALAALLAVSAVTAPGVLDSTGLWIRFDAAPLATPSLSPRSVRR